MFCTVVCTVTVQVCSCWSTHPHRKAAVRSVSSLLLLEHNTYAMAATIGIIKSATEAVLGIGGVGLTFGIINIRLSFNQVSIDNFTFKLFYKWSVSLFIASSVTVFSG